MRGLIAGVVATLVAVGVGFGVGVALERSGDLDLIAEPDAATVRDSRAMTFDCPDGDAVVAVGRADRVAVTGRSEDQLWVELRSPLDASAVVWMPAAQVDVDGGVERLPVKPCGEETTPSTIPPNPADDRPRTTSTTRLASTTTVAEETTTTEGSSTTTASTSSSSTTSTSTLLTLPTSSTTTTTTTTAPTTSTTLGDGGGGGEGAAP